jgi:hypothetical protein
VNNTVKALPKKRKHQTAQSLLFTLSEISLLKRQVLWYSSFIASYVWFMYWIAQDFFVWHKPFFEVNPVNYVGSIASMAFIWAGIKILKPNRTQSASPHKTPPPPLAQQPIPQPTQKSLPKLTPQSPLRESQQQEPQKTAPAYTPANSACAHHLGYLSQRQQSQEIPSECFTCQHLIQCMGSAN